MVVDDIFVTTLTKGKGFGEQAIIGATASRDSRSVHSLWHHRPPGNKMSRYRMF